MLEETKATKKCNLFRDIAAKLLERQCCAFNCPQIKLVLQHIRFSVTKLFIYLFFYFFIGNKIHSADINLRKEVVVSKLTEVICYSGRLFRFEFFSLIYKVPLLDLTIESFRVFHDNLQLSQKISVAQLAN